ncbi:MAG: hypothetical protein U0350_11260 [Caldilineaceae bacterium]
MFGHMLRDFSQFASVLATLVTIVAAIYALNTFDPYPLLLSIGFVIITWFVSGLAKLVG